LKGSGKNSHQGTEQDHLEGQAKGYAVRFPAHHSDNLFLWLYGLIFMHLPEIPHVYYDHINQGHSRLQPHHR
jgi:hypothetical protein